MTPPLVTLNEAQRENLRSIAELAARLRGYFISRTVWLDMLVSDIIASYFCQRERRRDLFFSEIVNGGDITFSKKIDLLIAILRFDFPDLLKQSPKLKDDLDNIRRLRNRMAHSHQFTIIFYEGGQTKEQVITPDDIETRIHKATNLQVQLTNIQDKISKAG